jgi:glycosyltransferase involved in cell wall biosynthesis
VKSQVPEAKLTIVGSHPPEQVLKLAALEDVEVTGYVPETAIFLDRAALSVAPLRYGAGMKGKVAEAMAAGLPVVTTSIGSQGFGAVSGEHCIIADSAGDFAVAVIRLLKNPALAQSIGTAGQRLVAGICGPEVVSRNVQDMLEAVSKNQRAPRKNLQLILYTFYDYLNAAAKKLARRVISQCFRSGA